MRTRPVSLIIISFTLILSSCESPPETLAGTQVACVSPVYTSSSLPPSPSASVTTKVTEPSVSPDLSELIHDPESYGYGILPIPLSMLRNADKRVFDPNKAKEYLLEYFLSPDSAEDFDFCYSVDKAQIKGDKLYLSISADIGVIDVNSAYGFFSEHFSLTDKDILKIPLFSGCVIHDGIMYNSEDSWKDSQDYDSLEDWEMSEEGNINGLELGNCELPTPVTVADGASIILLDYNNDYETGIQVTPAQLVEALSEESDRFLYTDLLFKYSEGEITSIVQMYVS